MFRGILTIWLYPNHKYFNFERFLKFFFEISWTEHRWTRYPIKFGNFSATFSGKNLILLLSKKSIPLSSSTWSDIFAPWASIDVVLSTKQVFTVPTSWLQWSSTILSQWISVDDASQSFNSKKRRISFLEKLKNRMFV